MQRGTQMRGQDVVYYPNAPASGLLGTPKEIVGESGSGEELVPHKSAFVGLRVALPLAFSLWGLIAALIWACRA